MSRAHLVLSVLVAISAPGRADSTLPERGPTVGPVAPRTDYRRARLSLSTTAFDDSNRVGGVAPRLTVSLPVATGGELRLGVGLSRVVREASEVAHPLAGASLSLPWGERVRASGALALHADDTRTLPEAQVGVHYTPWRFLGGGVSLRHRPFIEVADTLAVDEQAFHGAGAGGASDPARAGARSVDEVKVVLQGSPSGWSYAYAEGRQLLVDDGNRGTTLSAGLGVNVVRALLGPRPVELVARWDTYVAAFSDRRPDYYSPALASSQSPSAELRVRPVRGLELAGELGWSFAPDQAGAWFGGGAAAVRFGRVSAALRAQSKTEPWYRSRRVWLAIETDV